MFTCVQAAVAPPLALITYPAENFCIIDEIANPSRLGPRDFLTRPSFEMKMPCQNIGPEKCDRTKTYCFKAPACRYRDEQSAADARQEADVVEIRHPAGCALLRIRCIRACQTSSWPTEKKLSVGKGRTVWQGFYRMRIEGRLVGSTASNVFPQRGVRGMPERSPEHAPNPGSYSRGSQCLSCAHRRPLSRVLR